MYEKMKMLEDMAQAYLDAPTANRERALSVMTSEERKSFLEFVSFYRLMTDEQFYRRVQEKLLDDYRAEVC